MSRKIFHRFVLIFFSALFGVGAGAQQISDFDRARAQAMLKNIATDVEKHYYDPGFRGVDWPATVRQAQQQIQAAQSLNMALADIAQALITLNDSHTYFVPPSRPYIFHYGFLYQMVGDRCYITRVQPGSDAEAKGLKPGDELVSLDGFAPNRENLWKMKYRYNLLRPAPGFRLVLRNPQGQQRQLDVTAEYKQLHRIQDVTGNNIWDFLRKAERDEHRNRIRSEMIGKDVLVLKFPMFLFSSSQVSGKIADARKNSGLILDLRENPGGAVDTLKDFVSGLFDQEVIIGDRVGRKESKPERARTMGSHAFSGKLVVLVDSDSASAAELLARVVQLQKRGVVIGDRTSGSVMEAKPYTYKIGEEISSFYGASITEWNLVMSDGKSLEHTGVVPDETIVPTAADLAAGRDPVLARAAAILGATLSAEDAGKMFPYEWPQD